MEINKRITKGTDTPMAILVSLTIIVSGDTDSLLKTYVTIKDFNIISPKLLFQ